MSTQRNADQHCSICGKQGVKARGLCNAHYLRAKRAGTIAPKERPEERCTVCRARLRPYGASKDDWPRTKAKVSTNPLRCTAHQYGRKTGGYDFREDREVERVNMDQVRLVRRRIQERFEGDDYLLITEALGIGDDID